MAAEQAAALETEPGRESALALGLALASGWAPGLGLGLGLECRNRPNPWGPPFLVPTRVPTE